MKILIIALVSFFSISFADPTLLGEFVVRPFAGSVSVHNITTPVKWDAVNNEVIFMHEANYPNLSADQPIYFKAATRTNEEPMIPWALMEFTITTASWSRTFYIDFRDTGWTKNSTRYVHADIDMYIDVAN